MDEETKLLLRNIAHHLKWVIALLLAILGLLIAQSLGWLPYLYVAWAIAVPAWNGYGFKWKQHTYSFTTNQVITNNVILTATMR